MEHISYSLFKDPGPDDTRAPLCPECNGRTVKRKLPLAIGFHVCWQCQVCGFRPVRNWKGWSWLPQQGLELDEIPTVDNPAVANCGHCGESGPYHDHHYGPREHFGEDCKNWPIGPLCGKCHIIWHDTIGHPTWEDV